MRILLVNTFYYPNMQGGAEQSVKLLAEGLLNRGHEVAIYCGDSKDGKNTVEDVNGITVYRCTTGKFNLYRYSYEKGRVGALEKVTQKLLTYYNQEIVAEFHHVCDVFQPDIIHTNTLYGLPWYIWKYASKRNIAVVHTIRDIGIISPVQYGHEVNNLVLKAHQCYMRRLTKHVDGVTAPSEYTLQNSLEIGTFVRAKVKKCIVNSVDIDYELLENIINKRRVRASKHIKFMYAGRLIDFKGVKHMIEAFEQMKYRDCELVICGDGEMLEYVQVKSKEDSRIVCCGKLDNQQLAEKYTECDVLLVPSIWPEPFGRVIIEGNKYGMPVIAGRFGGMPEIIKTTRGGELYEAGNTSQLANAMDHFTDRSVYSGYFDAILGGIEVYNINKQITAFENLYMQVKH